MEKAFHGEPLCRDSGGHTRLTEFCPAGRAYTSGCKGLLIGRSESLLCGLQAICRTGLSPTLMLMSARDLDGQEFSGVVAPGARARLSWCCLPGSRAAFRDL